MERGKGEWKKNVTFERESAGDRPKPKTDKTDKTDNREITIHKKPEIQQLSRSPQLNTFKPL